MSQPQAADVKLITVPAEQMPPSTWKPAPAMLRNAGEASIAIPSATSSGVRDPTYRRHAAAAPTANSPKLTGGRPVTSRMSSLSTPNMLELNA
jgi:hypothetical protein